MTDIRISERIYLSKEDDIYVDHGYLPQHQVEGIRFLYTQFKKNKPGVVLNDPPGYGKSVQVVLFLNAVRKCLAGPVLILSRENELPMWRDHFQTWTQYDDDIVIEPSNPFAKKSVFVCTRRAAEPMTRRAWAVAVVDDELAARAPADYKICLLSADVKENLHSFASIYQYIFPKEVFDVKEFTPNKYDHKDIVSKSLLLDAFLEEVVIRGKNFTPFKKPQMRSRLAIAEPPKVSRKNKDATGTKIKRSRPRVEAETSQVAKIPRIDPPLRNATITSKDYYKNREMDVESFIKNEKPIESDGVEELMDFQAMIKSDSNYYETAQDIVRHENGSVKVNGDKVIVADEKSEYVNESEVNTADYQEAIDDIVRNENNSGKNENDVKINDVESVDIDGDSVNEIGVCNDKDLDASVKEATKETIQDVVNNGSKKDLDSKIKDLEEKTLNKFKGSLLDSIF